MVKSISLSLLFNCLWFCAVAQDEYYQKIAHYQLPAVDIDCTITLEDSANSFYSLSWSAPYVDSIALSNGPAPSSELHCYILTKGHIVGYYKGLSTPMHHCNFQTNDTVIEVIFRWRPIPYYSSSKDSSLAVIPALSLTSLRPMDSEYLPIFMPVKNGLVQQYTLQEDMHSVILSYGIPSRIDPLGYPTIMGAELGNRSWVLDRYYLNTKSGHIRTGQNWLTFYDPEDLIAKNQWVLIHPEAEYTTTKGEEHSGAELIEKGKVKIHQYTLEQFWDHPFRFSPY